MRATIYTCTVQSGKHSCQIIDLRLSNDSDYRPSS